MGNVTDLGRIKPYLRVADVFSLQSNSELVDGTIHVASATALKS